MHKKFNKVKSAILSGMIAATSVAGSFAMTAPALSSSAASDDYAKLLQYSLYFYDANMCGKQVGESTALSWRDDCHTSDDVDGGFHDAGDHAKFGLPAGYSASTLGWSYYEYKDAFDATGQSAHLKNITDYFATFFKNSTTLSGDTVTNFVYQIGDGDMDHAVWCSPEKHVDNSRKTFSTSSGASDIAAEYAAALAVNYVNFGNAEDLKYAKALFDFSTKYNQKATDGPNNFYSSWDYYDDQAWAAGWLYFATNDNTYKDFLNTYMNSSNKGSSGMDGCQWGVYSTMSWNNVSMGAAVLQAEITGDSADWEKVTKYLSEKGANSSDYYFESRWGSARYNTAQQLAALVATKHGAASYNDWAKGQMDYIMGNKGVGSASPQCFVVGFADNSSKNPHHRAASGYESFDEMGESTVTSPNGHVLVGALVGGPLDANGTYGDTLKDYEANEVTLDYNAAFVGAAAGLYSVYKTGSPVSSIEGVKKIYNEAVSNPNVTTAPAQTTAKTTQATTPTQTTPSQSGGGTFEIKPNLNYVYEKDSGMIGWKWADLGLGANDKPTKVEIKISANGNIGKWQGAFGSSTKKEPDYWVQSDDMEVTVNGTTATLTWNIDSATSEIIQTQYNGEIKFGTWWVDCGQFTIESVKAYTGNASSAVTTQATQATQNPTPVQTNPSQSNGSAFEIKPNLNYVYEKDSGMIGWKWADLGLGANDKPTKVEIKISASKNIGKWQGAFGSSTKKEPDYWVQSDDMEVTVNGTTATLTWNIDSATSEIIQTQYNGEIKFGTWWVDCGQFTIESVKAYTGSSSSAVTTQSTQATQATANPVNSTQNNNGNTKVSLWGDANCDGNVTIADATAIIQHLGNADEYALSAQGAVNADVIDNGDGVTGADANAIQAIEAGFIKASDLPMSKSNLDALIGSPKK